MRDREVEIDIEIERDREEKSEGEILYFMLLFSLRFRNSLRFRDSVLIFLKKIPYLVF